MDNERHLSGREDPLLGAVPRLPQLVVQLGTSDDPTTQAVTGLVGGKLREIAECQGKYSIASLPLKN